MFRYRNLFSLPILLLLSLSASCGKGFLAAPAETRSVQPRATPTSTAATPTFSPDSCLLATGSLDGTLCSWETGSGRLLMQARQHNGQVGDVAFAADETWQTYTSDAFGFTIDYPPGWESLEVSNETYEATLPQVWLTGSGFPPPHTDARADIVLILLEEDPTPEWQADKFDDYSSRTVRLGGHSASLVSGINRESRLRETAVILPMEAYTILALPNGSDESLAYLLTILSTLR